MNEKELEAIEDYLACEEWYDGEQIDKKKKEEEENGKC